MKKLYLLPIAILFFFGSFSQSIQDTQLNHPYMGSELNSNSKRPTQKAYLDTLFYEDFDSLSALNWTIVNSSTGGPFGPAAEPWKWVPAGSRPGPLAPTAGPLQSTSSMNGYMYLAPDSTVTFVPTPFDTYFTSNAISINPSVASVIVRFEQSQLYCCGGNNDLLLEVSTDSFSWTSFDATNGRNPSIISPNAEVLEINVSSVLANATTAYVRFRATGMVAYYWMIDDLLIYEGPSNNMQLKDVDLSFKNSNFSSVVDPVYTIIPNALFNSLNFIGYTFNYGANPQTNVSFNTSVFMDSTVNGNPGSGLVYSSSSLIGTVQSLEADTVTISPSFQSTSSNPTAPGYYRAVMSVSSDSINQQANSAKMEYEFLLSSASDTVIALDRGAAFFTQISGPAAYVGGGNDGDVIGVALNIDSATSFSLLATSLSYWVPNYGTSASWTQTLSPRIWRVNPAATSLNTLPTPYAQSSASISINPINNPAILGTWVTVPFFPPAALNPGESYYFGIEQTGGAASGAELWAGRDVGQEKYNNVFSNVFFLNEPANGRWIATDEILGVRLNVQLTVGVEESSSSESSAFRIMPNPNTGLFRISLMNQVKGNYNLKVFNNLGQTVLAESINVNGEFTKQIDLSSFDKGIYFISIENGESRMVEKVVVK
ncbi:MAG: hypothetical protein CMP59_12795 [Flavobacteriales bacterium]|nr:hypothetical protein [Flavobacteriales bacterium]|tara:strand:- start:354 stop:2324 length:1971 start_codon:yes stop_codon:yes gene_type:complete